MAITDISIPLKYVFTQATEPNDKTEGKLWYNTSDNSLYTSDGTNYIKLGIDTTFFNEIFNNSLDILDIQAEATLDGGQSAYMVRDLFTDADGYLDTIDTGNTTATFETDNYNNILITDTEEKTTGTVGADGTVNMEITISSKGYFSSLGMYGTAGGSKFRVEIIQNGITKLYKTDISRGNLILNRADYTSLLDVGTVTLKITATSYNLQVTTSTESYSGTHFSYSNQKVPISNATYAPKIFEYTAVEIDDLIIQTLKQDLGLEPSHFQVYAHKQTISGTGNITASVSFDNGANYQTVNLNTTTTITDKGDEMILKLNLNAGASNGLASCEGYGVMFW